jgi:hypothetical protein
MNVVNRRNALLGWAVWEIAKRVALTKAKRAVPKVDTDSKRPKRAAAVAAALAAAGGAVVLWRKTQGDDTGVESPE